MRDSNPLGHAIINQLSSLTTLFGVQTHSPAVAPAHLTKFFPVVFILLDFRVAIKLIMVTIPKKNWKKVGLRPPNNRVDNKSSIKMINYYIVTSK